MPRTSVRVRDADQDDLPVLLRFADELREVAPTRRGTGPVRGGTVPGNLAARYAELLDDPDRRVVLAVGGDDEPLGMAILSRGHASALLDLPAVQISHLVVAGRHRRRGAGHALVAAAAAYAEEIGVEHVVVGVAPSSREGNRFFARLGFAPLVVRRVALLPALRRALAGPDPHLELDGAVRAHVVRRRGLRGAVAAGRARL